MNAEPIKYEVDKQIRRAVRGSLHDDRNALSRQLRLRAADRRATMTIRSTCWCIRRFRCCRAWWCAVARSACLRMDDESGGDAKVLAVPTDDICPLFEHWKSIADVPEIRLRQIQHFFEHYKDLEAGQMGQGDRLGRRRGRARGDLERHQTLRGRNSARSDRAWMPRAIGDSTARRSRESRCCWPSTLAAYRPPCAARRGRRRSTVFSAYRATAILQGSGRQRHPASPRQSRRRAGARRHRQALVGVGLRAGAAVRIRVQRTTAFAATPVNIIARWRAATGEQGMPCCWRRTTTRCRRAPEPRMTGPASPACSRSRAFSTARPAPRHPIVLAAHRRRRSGIARRLVVRARASSGRSRSRPRSIWTRAAPPGPA